VKQNNVNCFRERGFHKFFVVISQSNDPLQKKKHQNMHPQLINMDLHEGMVIKGV
jgi:hypothetical protein